MGGRVLLIAYVNPSTSTSGGRIDRPNQSAWPQVARADVGLRLRRGSFSRRNCRLATACRGIATPTIAF